MWSINRCAFRRLRRSSRCNAAMTLPTLVLRCRGLMLTLLGLTGLDQGAERGTWTDAASVRSRGMPNSDVKNEGYRNVAAAPSRIPPNQNGELFRLLRERPALRA